MLRPKLNMNRCFKNNYLFALSFVFFSISTYSQSKENSSVFGFISDSNHSPLENVVIILEEDQGNVIAFGQSDIMGKYSIEYNTEQDSIYIKFRRLGLETVVRKIPVSLQELNMVMELASENTLEEVVVRNKRPVESKGDTKS